MTGSNVPVILVSSLILLLKQKIMSFYDLVYMILKLILLLLMATTNVERIFSATSLVKNK
jgi:hypothetical protein